MNCILDQVWTNLDWNRKFNSPVTDDPAEGKIIYVWYADKPNEVAEAAQVLATLEEETEVVVRSAYYAEYSRSAALTIIETNWSEIDN
jgi:hypothetical protein